jgi:hypothetical protein
MIGAAIFELDLALLDASFLNLELQRPAPHRQLSRRRDENRHRHRVRAAPNTIPQQYFADD